MKGFTIFTFGMGCLFLFVGLIFLGMFMSNHGEKEIGIKEVDCFDRWDNKIKGETCIKETTKTDLINYYVMVSFLIIWFFAVTFFIFKLSFIIKEMDELEEKKEKLFEETFYEEIKDYRDKQNTLREQKKTKSKRRLNK